VQEGWRVPMLLVPGEFIGAAGFPVPFKIECDYMLAPEWKVIVEACLPKLQPFGKVIGVPKGGLILAELLKPHVTPKANTVLVVDDVWNTGYSMRKIAQKQLGARFRYWQGLVAYSRGSRPINVVAFMQLVV